MLKKYIFTLIFLLISLTLIRPVLADTQLLPSPWHLSGNNGAVEAYQSISPNTLMGVTNISITYDLHGMCALGGDASAIIFDQNGWHYISLSDYGTNCQNGLQTVVIPITKWGLNLSQPVGTLHTRFWHQGVWTVDITNISIVTSITPTVTPTPIVTPTITPTPIVSITPTPIINPKAPSHIVVVVEENHNLQDTLGVGYFTTLANNGALMVNSFAITHPSEPNYLALFEGSTRGISDDNCPPTGYPFTNPNLATQLISSNLTFTGYAESQPSTSPLNPCINGAWRGYHVPWLFYNNIPSSSELSFASFPTNFSNLPTVSFVIPNAQDDAHDGTLQQASDWLQTNIESYRVWAMTNNSLLIVTTDEDSNANNLIYTVFAGQMVKNGIYNETINHYNILSTIENFYGLTQLNTAAPIIDIFK